MPINLTGLASLLLTLIWLRGATQIDPLQACVLVMTAYAVPVMFLELLLFKTWRRPSTGLDFSVALPWNRGRLITKLLGFYATLFLVFLLYWLFPEYEFAGESPYAPYWASLNRVIPWIMLGAPFYFAFVDRHMNQPHDAYWQMGMLFTGRWSQVNAPEVIQHLLGWLVKAFFLALMYIYAVASVAYFREAELAAVVASFQGMFDFLWHGLFLIDLVLATVGYVLTLRLLDSHIRTVEPTLLGWMAALACYDPFWTLLGAKYLAYENPGLTWGSWLAAHPIAYTVWGTAIVLLVAIYALSTVPFGLRFSNLTHRGILTNGPYRYCKHPAYVSKNLSWWLVSVPFIPNGDILGAAKHCGLLLCLNLIYYIRARTEERHLSRDPVYVEYATAMNQRSVFRGLARALPFLKYRPDRVPVSRTLPAVDYA